MVEGQSSESSAFTMRVLASISKLSSTTFLPTRSWCRSFLLRWTFLRFGGVFLLVSLTGPGLFQSRACRDGHEGLFLPCDGSITASLGVEESQYSIVV